MNSLTEKINSYFAILIITLAGSGATLTIVHVANSSTLATVLAIPSVLP